MEQFRDAFPEHFTDPETVQCGLCEGTGINQGMEPDQAKVCPWCKGTGELEV